MKGEAFRARDSERPRPPDRGGGAERRIFHSPVPCPAAAALPQGNTPEPTDRKGGVRIGGEGRARRAQDPTSALGGRNEQERDTLEHNRFQF